MYQLYYCRGKASLTPHMLLEELNVPYALVPVDVNNNQHKSPAYLTLNPAGKIPLLIDNGVVISETAAICLYLIDKHPEKNLAPTVGTVERAEFYKWLIYLTNTLQTELMIYFRPQKYSLIDDVNIKHNAYRNIAAMLDIIENALVANHAKNKGPYLLGEECSAVDLFILMLARWTRDFASPARARLRFSEYLQRVSSRPAVLRTFEAEEIHSPYY